MPSGRRDSPGTNPNDIDPFIERETELQRRMLIDAIEGYAVRDGSPKATKEALQAIRRYGRACRTAGLLKGVIWVRSEVETKARIHDRIGGQAMRELVEGVMQECTKRATTAVDKLSR